MCIFVRIRVWMRRETHNVCTVGTFFLLFLEYAHTAERDILNPCDEI
jgi:hypothetical protein